MFGLILIFFVGRAFYRLAEKFNKKPWPYAIAGVASYYVGAFAFSILLGIILGIFNPGIIDRLNNILLGLAAIPFGVAACYGFYAMLKKNWSSKPKSVVEVDGLIQHFGEKEVDKNFE